MLFKLYVDIFFMPIRMTTKHIAIKIARELRKNQTVAEIKFWSHVRGRKFKGYKFQRQFPIFYEYYERERFFLADFYCCELHLVVEIDGGIHEQQEDYDQIRTEIMEIQKKLRVVRFMNEDVMISMNEVLSRLHDFMIQIK